MKPKVIIFIDWYLPGYRAGGPIKSVYNIIESLKEEIDFSVVTRNTDFGEIVPYESIIPNKWIAKNSYKIMYLDSFQNIFKIRNLLLEVSYDYIYLNSLFSFKFTILPIIAHKFSSKSSAIVLAPRGMLGFGALNLKPFKKKIFLSLAKRCGLYKDITWHASTQLEAAEIKCHFSKNISIKIAENIPNRRIVDYHQTKSSYNTSFFFVSRISPKKNLIGALRALNNLDLSNNIKFDIIGPIEDKSYWEQCQEIIRNLPSNISVNYLGHVENYKLVDVLKHYHFMIFLTLSENYGHVIIESLSCGCPVILSDQTPWRNLETHNVGWDISLSDNNKIVEIIKKCVLMGDDDFQLMKKKIGDFLNNEVFIDDVFDQNRRLFSH